MQPISHQPPSDDFPFPGGRHTGNLIRLGRLLEYPSRFRLVLAEHNAPPYRDQIIAWLTDRFPRSATWPIPPNLSANDLIEHLRTSARSRKRCRSSAEDRSPEAESRLFVELNYRREDLAAAALPSSWCLWLPKGAATRFAQKAPDLWAWRTTVLGFSLAPPERIEIHHRTFAFLGEDAERLRTRRREISEHLQAKGEPTHADGALLLKRRVSMNVSVSRTRPSRRRSRS